MLSAASVRRHLGASARIYLCFEPRGSEQQFEVCARLLGRRRRLGRLGPMRAQPKRRLGARCSAKSLYLTEFHAGSTAARGAKAAAPLTRRARATRMRCMVKAVFYIDCTLDSGLTRNPLGDGGNFKSPGRRIYRRWGDLLASRRQPGASQLASVIRAGDARWEKGQVRELNANSGETRS